jgi:hypothetical protein
MSTSALHASREPPDADRHVRWCGGQGPVAVPGRPICSLARPGEVRECKALRAARRSRRLLGIQSASAHALSRHQLPWRAAAAEAPGGFERFAQLL